MSDNLWFGFDDRKKNGCKKAKKLCKASRQVFLKKQNWKEIRVKRSDKTFIVTSSKRHKSNQKLNEWIELNKINRKVEVIERGSSLKICLVAEGSAHFYPRFGRTCVWDTAAGHAIVNAAGGSIISFLTKQELKYEKSVYNSDFIVSNALF